MTSRDAVGAFFFLAAGFFLALAVWPLSIMSRFDFWVPHVQRLQTSGGALRVWRGFYGLVAGFFLVVAVVVAFTGRSG
jgi:hypothetical protein